MYTIQSRFKGIYNSKNPDLVLLRGDYIEHEIEELDSISSLKELKSKYKVYGVMGNHDYAAFGFAREHGGGGDAILADQIIEFLDASNSTNSNNDAGKPITVIRNEKVIVNESLMIIGLDDLWAHLRDKEKAYSNVDGVVYRILLSHNQEGFEITKENVDLFLFGHTHCGQIRLPGLGSIPKLFGFSGEYDVHVYTTCGLAPVSRLLSILRL